MSAGMTRSAKLTGMLVPPIIALCLASALDAATKRDFEDFRQAMLDRGCRIASSGAGDDLRRELGWSKSKFSEVMTELTISGEFHCPSGCTLRDSRCK